MKWAIAINIFLLYRKYLLCKYIFKFINGFNNKIKIITPIILNNKLALIIFLHSLLVLIVARYPVNVVPILEPNIIIIEHVKLIKLESYIFSTILIIPDDDWIIAVDEIPNSKDKIKLFWIFWIIWYIKGLDNILLNPLFNISKPSNIKPIYVKKRE